MKFGIRANLDQFSLQLLLVFFVGITVGMERNVIPVLAKEEFAIASSLVTLSFIASFGFVKALVNLYGGRWSERIGRKKILIIGWLAAARPCNWIERVCRLQWRGFWRHCYRIPG